MLKITRLNCERRIERVVLCCVVKKIVPVVSSLPMCVRAKLFIEETCRSIRNESLNAQAHHIEHTNSIKHKIQSCVSKFIQFYSGKRTFQTKKKIFFIFSHSKCLTRQMNEICMLLTTFC